VQQLLVHHDARRVRFVKSRSDWEQTNSAPDETIPFSCVDLSAIPDAAQRATIEAEAAALQISLNLSSGPIVRVAFFDLGADKTNRLLLVIHHLAVDGVSWRILLEDLQTAYEQLSRGERIQLHSKTTSFKHWAEKLASYARSETAKNELTYWQSTSRTQITRLPVDHTLGDNTVASSRVVSVSLSPIETRALLQEVPKAYKTQINDILLTALVQTLGAWTGHNSVLLDLEGHGREYLFEGVDLSRTVGWFTTIFPVLLALNATDNLGEAIQSIKEQLRAVPNRGIGYGVLRYLSGDADITSQLSMTPPAEVSFNYLGQFDWGTQEDSFFTLAPESVGSEYSQQGISDRLLDINSLVVDSQLKVDWTYSENFHQRTTIENLAQDFVERLRSLIAHCTSSNVVEHQSIHDHAQPMHEFQHEANKLPLPLHLLELPQNISDLLPDDAEFAYPLAKMQEFMLHHYSNDHQKMGVYHAQESFDICDDDLSLDAFKNAIEILVRKHPILRTVFIIQNGKPVCQVVRKNLRFSINEQDISHLGLEDQENYIDDFVQQDRKNLFKVEDPSEALLRVWIFQKATNRFEFFTSIHHAITDGWSSTQFLNQLYELYSSLKKGGEPTVVPAANVYKEFVALEKEIIASPDASSFWKLHLKSYIHRPLEPLIAPEQSIEATTEEYNFESKTISNLRELCRELKVSPKALFLSAYLDLMGRVMQEKMVSVGIVSNGRTERLSDPFGALGLFWNMVPFCQPIIENKGVQIKNVQQSLIHIEPYVRYPLLEILSDQQKTELFFATFNFVNSHNDENTFEESNLQIIPRRAHDKFNFPLNYGVSMSPENTSIRVEYDRMYFTRQDIRLMLEDYVEILKNART
jgi:non-ribosomal peptide synthase protein (TIGR01720 family)